MWPLLILSLTCVLFPLPTVFGDIKDLQIIWYSVTYPCDIIALNVSQRPNKPAGGRII